MDDKTKLNGNGNGNGYEGNNLEPRKKIKVVVGDDLEDLFGEESEEEKSLKEEKKTKTKKTKTEKLKKSTDKGLEEKVSPDGQVLGEDITKIDISPYKTSRGISTNSQEYFIKRYNTLGKKMLSFPDYYAIGKSNDLDLIEKIKKSIIDKDVVTSTSIEYDKSTNATRIIHDYKSTVTKPIEIKTVFPDYYDNLSEAMDDNEGLEFVQSLLGTKDNRETIETTLIKVFGIDPEDMVLSDDLFYNDSGVPLCVNFNISKDKEENFMWIRMGNEYKGISLGGAPK